MKLREILAAWFATPRFSIDSGMTASTALSSRPTLDPFDGLWIGQSKRRRRLVRYPDGKLRRVDHDFDASVFDDPDSMTKAERQMAKLNVTPSAVPNEEPVCGVVQRIALAMLAASPSSLITVTYNSRGDLTGATITPAKRGLTAGVFRAAYRTLPRPTKRVVFAAGMGISPQVQDAATQAADAFLVRVDGFIVSD